DVVFIPFRLHLSEPGGNQLLNRVEDRIIIRAELVAVVRELRDWPVQVLAGEHVGHESHLHQENSRDALPRVLLCEVLQHLGCFADRHINLDRGEGTLGYEWYRINPEAATPC